MSRIWKIAFFLCLAGLISGCDQFDSAKMKERVPFKVGVVGPMTGPETVYGGQLRYGAGQAMYDINMNGGALQRQMTLRAVNDRCDPKMAAAIAAGLAIEKVPVVIGHFCSASSIAAAPIYAQAKIVMITPSSSDPELTDAAAARGDDTIFRVVPRDDRQGAALARHILDRYKGAAVAIIRDDSRYGGDVADSTRAALAAGGVRPVLEETVATGTRNFTDLVARLKAAGVGVIVFGGYAPEAGALAVEVRRQGLDAALGGGDGLLASEFWRIAGSAGEGTFVTGLPDPQHNGAALKPAERLAHFGIDAGGYTLFAYAAVQAYAQAVDRAGTLDGPAVAKVLHTGGFDTVLGRLSFDAKGDVRGIDYILYMWHNGAFQPSN
jgi:branched-chain amino acid transport system substrate-binding protein